ncbi:MAG: DnaJ domain-containing protein [Deltaproteobacteria bacterium]|nr:DnaJ domain-containing protein [Deltaproteobacteria bacterium]
MKKILLILAFVLGLVYIVSPVDLIPDGFPVIGWIDDIFVGWVLGYYLAHGRLPVFVSRFLSGLTGKRPVSGEKSDATGRQEDTISQDDPYAVLGVLPGASADEIRKAYQEMVQQYHPDKVSHLGREFQELAREKFIRIQEAYEKLK